MAAFGLRASDFDEEEIGIYPDCWQAVCLFADLGTQWRRSMGSIVGLDYQAVAAVMDMQGIHRLRRRQLFDDIQIMEEAALAEIREQEHG